MRYVFTAVGTLVFAGYVGFILGAGAQREGAPNACPAIGTVVRPEGTPEEVCGKVLDRRWSRYGVNEEGRAATIRCWNIVTAAWKRYYECGGTRPKPQDGGAPR